MEKIKLSINNWLESGKGKNILVIIIVILVGLSSFEVGRLSKANSSSGIKIEYPAELQSQSANIISSVNSVSNPTKTTPKTTTNNTSQINQTSKQNTEQIFFASNRGHKYYPLGCSAGKTIKQENRIYFATREEAEAAGYELSSSCR